MSRDLSSLPLVCVLWDDAYGRATGEYTVDEITNDLHRPSCVKTFGLLVREDERGVSLAQEMTADPESDVFTHYRGLAFIPRGMLKELIYLGVPKRPAKKRERKADA